MRFISLPRYVFVMSWKSLMHYLELCSCLLIRSTKMISIQGRVTAETVIRRRFSEETLG